VPSDHLHPKTMRVKNEQPAIGINYAALRGCLSIRDILQLIGWKPTEIRGPQWRGPCPLHRAPDQDRSFSVHVGRHLYRCFQCGRTGNQLDLWCDYSGLPIYPAALDLCHRLNILLPQTRNSENPPPSTTPPATTGAP
jgi:DNA primase